MNDEEIAALLEACERQTDTKKVAQSRAIISVFVFGGLRRTECLDLHVDDIDLKAKSILVRSGKGSKSRKVFVPQACVEALGEWLAVRPVGCKHDWLWAYDINRRVHTVGLKHLLEEIKAIAGYKDARNIMPHSLRHACATRLLRNGANIRDIQAFLGHSTLQITQVYLHSDEEQLKEIAELSALPQSAPQEQKARRSSPNTPPQGQEGQEGHQKGRWRRDVRNGRRE